MSAGPGQDSLAGNALVPEHQTRSSLLKVA